MDWKGANQLPQRKDLEKQGESTTQTSSRDDPLNRSSKRDGDKRHAGSSETNEAAVNRLNKAYQALIQCLQVLYKKGTTKDKEQLNNIVTNDPGTEPINNTNEEDSIAILELGRTARRLCETALIRDERISVHLSHMLQEQDVQNEAGNSQRLASYSRLNNRQRQTLQKLAYLSLSNYADLLLAGCACYNTVLDSINDERSLTILDRGITKPMSALKAVKCSCLWRESNAKTSEGTNDENAMEIDTPSTNTNVSDIQLCSLCVQSTTQLAVDALLDATEIDGSDPVLWLKLACASRRLGRCEQSLNILGGLTRYRHLERYALARAQLVLEQAQMPPNRLVDLAYDEWTKQQQTEEFSSTYYCQPDPVDEDKTNVINIPRYSWSVLGRKLTKICRETMSFDLTSRSVTSDASITSDVVLDISLLIVLPTAVLMQIGDYLDTQSRRNLENTCRTISTAFLSGRSAPRSRPRPQKRLSAVVQSTKTGDKSLANVNDENVANSALLEQQQQSGDHPKPQEQSNPKRSEPAASPSSSQRTSKRLQSQIINSSKKASRASRRSSITYCLLAATLGCTTSNEQYKKALNAALEWNSWCHSSDLLASVAFKDWNDSSLGFTRLDSGDQTPLDVSSLLHFIFAIKSQQLVSPIKILFKFLCHISRHLQYAYASDPSGSIVLTSCILDAFDFLTKHCQSVETITICWANGQLRAPNKSGEETLDLLALDLLHLELRLKRCDREDYTNTSFNGDAAILSRSLPQLLTCFDEYDSTLNNSTADEFLTALKVRLYWLIAHYHFWQSRVILPLSHSPDAESQGISYVNEAIKLLRADNIRKDFVVHTPHLVSPVRTGIYWTELKVSSMNTFISEIHASSIVQTTQAEFAKVVDALNVDDTEMSIAEKETFASIGRKLLKRYQHPVGSSDDNYDEIVSDFMVRHGLFISSTKLENSEDFQTLFNWFLGIIPFQAMSKHSLRAVSSPSTLEVLLISLYFDDCPEEVHRLVVNLTLSIFRRQLMMLKQSQLHSRNKNDDDGFNSDSDDDSSIQEFGNNTSSATMTRESSKFVQLIRFVLLLLRQIELSVTSFPDHVQGTVNPPFDEITDLAAIALELLATITGNDFYIHSLLVSNEIILIAQHLYFLVRNVRSYGSAHQVQSLDLLYIRGLIKVLHITRTSILDVKYIDSKKEKLQRKTKIDFQATMAASILVQLSSSLSDYQVQISKGRINRHFIFTDQEMNSDPNVKNIFSSLCNDILWYRNVFQASMLHHESKDSALISQYIETYVFDKRMCQELNISTTFAIVATSGSLISTNKSFPLNQSEDPTYSESITLDDFIFSDDSENEWISDSEDLHYGVQEELRVILQAVQCIGLVYADLDDNIILHHPSLTLYTTKHGSLLPLILVRTLNNFSDALLRHFLHPDDSTDENDQVWSAYPDGVQQVGASIDRLLCKAYRCLYGFSMNSPKDGKEVSSSLASPNLSKVFPPEDLNATVSLYRCLMRRIELDGRKTLPKQALELILSSLPDEKQNNLYVDTTKYLFRDERLNFQHIVSSVTKCDIPASCFKELSTWNIHSKTPADAATDPAYIVRRGVNKALAHGSLPTYQDPHTVDFDVRSASLQIEDELSKKFFAVLDCLCYEDYLCYDNWYKAFLCLSAKADVIADRLGLQRGFLCSENFFCSNKCFSTDPNVQLTEIHRLEEQEKSKLVDVWMPSMGTDLSVYIRYCWTSFTSLEKLSSEIYSQVSSYGDDADKERRIYEYRVWKSMNERFVSGDFQQWEQCWGSLFVSSLRQMALKCLVISSYIHLKSNSAESNRTVFGETVESLGVFLYSQLFAGQQYGYPMRRLYAFEKRDLALCAMNCLAFVLDFTNKSDERNARHWDLKLIIGKCNEKIASTYKNQAYTNIQDEMGDGNSSMRLYEKYMSNAIGQYAISYSEAKTIENRDGVIIEQSGGSDHGSAEALYRLHGSRLKCLVYGVSVSPRDSSEAELEALRLTEQHWFSDSNKSTSERNVRERIWDVLSDIVFALAQCRTDHAFFHRSVYRHAQALLWAPVLYDPDQGRRLGSFGEVPSTLAVKIRGLNTSTNAVNSAHAVISTLFDKKRSQLCAVWVTTSSNGTALQSLNNTVRKYDSLRGKYISAYIDTLKHCKMRNATETFLRWIYTSSRDLPATFSASALYRGTMPSKSHLNDSILPRQRAHVSTHFQVSAKRKVNGAFASIVAEELLSINEKTTEVSKEALTKAALACFLRLNCPVDKFTRRGRSWNMIRNSEDIKPVCDAVINAYSIVEDQKQTAKTGLSNDWSGEGQIVALLSTALNCLKAKYPTLPASFSTQKVVKPRKPRQKKVEPDEDLAQYNRFDVPVPPGLSTGDTLTATVTTKEGKSIKIRLAVPPGNPSTIRCQVNINAKPSATTANTDASGASNKRQKTANDSAPI